MKLLKKVFIASAITMSAFTVAPKIMPSMQNAYTVQAATVKSYKLTQFKNEKFYKIKDVSKKSINFFKVKTSKTIKYDLDKDGKQDNIKVKKSNKNGIKKCTLYINGKKVTSLEEYNILYIVDLNKKDNYVDLVLNVSAGGDEETHAIYQKRGNNVKKIGEIGSMEDTGDLLINKNGKIVTRDLTFINISPYVTDRYYSLSKKGKLSTKKLDAKAIKNVVFKSGSNIEYATSRKNLKNYYKAFNSKYIKTLKKNTKFNIISFEDGWNIKIKLKNNKTVYVTPTY